MPTDHAGHGQVSRRPVALGVSAAEEHFRRRPAGCDCPRPEMTDARSCAARAWGSTTHDEHRGFLVEVGVYDLGDVSVEAVAVGSLGEWPYIDRPPGDLRLTRPLRFRALNRVDRGAVQCEPRIPAQIRTLARVRHRAEGELSVLEGHLDPGDPRRPVGSHGGNRLVPVPVEEPAYALRELRFRALDVLPRRHAPNIAQATEGKVAGMSKTLSATIRFAARARPRHPLISIGRAQTARPFNQICGGSGGTAALQPGRSSRAALTSRSARSASRALPGRDDAALRPSYRPGQRVAGAPGLPAGDPAASVAAPALPGRMSGAREQLRSCRGWAGWRCGQAQLCPSGGGLCAAM